MLEENTTCTELMQPTLRQSLSFKATCNQITTSTGVFSSVQSSVSIHCFIATVCTTGTTTVTSKGQGSGVEQHWVWWWSGVVLSSAGEADDVMGQWRRQVVVRTLDDHWEVCVATKVSWGGFTVEDKKKKVSEKAAYQGTKSFPVFSFYNKVNKIISSWASLHHREAGGENVVWLVHFYSFTFRFVDLWLALCYNMALLFFIIFSLSDLTGGTMSSETEEMFPGLLTNQLSHR